MTISLKIQIILPLFPPVNYHKISELQIPLRNIIKFFDSEVRIINLPMIKNTNSITKNNCHVCTYLKTNLLVQAILR